jgi:hypothetical protein
MIFGMNFEMDASLTPDPALAQVRDEQSIWESSSFG